MAKPTHVLVVEDEAALADLLKYNLEKEGYRVSVANDGEEALVVADESAPDLVVLDWMLPKAPGIEVCRRLRARQDTRNTPIVMLTARTEESDRIRGLDVGTYISAPRSSASSTT
jgi:two-component system phosphate regulon response regulator PhoB